MTVPADVYERIARTWERAGAPMLEHVSTCHTERGAQRVAGKYRYAEVRRNAGAFEVWAVVDDGR